MGQLLLMEAIAIAQSKTRIHLVRRLEESNHKALAFYKKNNFISFDTHTSPWEKRFKPIYSCNYNKK
jgi:hypothetical protein